MLQVFFCSFLPFELTFRYIWNIKLILSLILAFLLTEMDDEDCERRRMECLDEMSNLEKQFTDLKDQ